MSSRKLVALDLTGVLEDSWPVKRAWLRQHAGIDFGDHPISRRGILERLGCGEDFYRKLIAHAYSDDQIADHIPIRGAAEALRDLTHAGLDFAILTSRVEARRDATTAWLRTHGFADFVQSLVMLGVPGMLEEDHIPGSKLRWCIEKNALALVDDSVRNLAGDYQPEGARTIRRFLFDTQEVSTARDNIVNVRDWQELRAHLEQLV